jgi:hypothetical protein
LYAFLLPFGAPGDVPPCIRQRPFFIALAKQFEAEGLSYRKISAKLAKLGHLTRTGKPHVASAVQKMLED